MTNEQATEVLLALEEDLYGVKETAYDAIRKVYDLWNPRTRWVSSLRRRRRVNQEELKQLLRTDALNLTEVIDAMIDVNSITGVGRVTLAADLYDYIVAQIPMRTAQPRLLYDKGGKPHLDTTNPEDKLQMRLLELQTYLIKCTAGMEALIKAKDTPKDVRFYLERTYKVLGETQRGILKAHEQLPT